MLCVHEWPVTASRRDESPLADAEVVSSRLHTEPIAVADEGLTAMTGKYMPVVTICCRIASGMMYKVAGPCRFGGTQWHMQSVLRDSVESSDDEFFDARAIYSVLLSSPTEEMVEGKSAILIGMSQWNSNDLVEQIETIGKLEENQGEEPAFCSSGFLQEKQRELYRASLRKQRFPAQGSVEIHEDNEEGVQHQNCKTHVLILILHGGNILDTASGDHSSKLADINTFSSVFEKVTRAHFPASLGHILMRLVPCPAICSAAFSLVSNLNPYSYDESCLSSSEDHIPLAALPLLAVSSPQYQDAVAMVISRANQVYNEFLKSTDGAGFNGQVCLIGDCIGGILGFDAICYNSNTADESRNSSRRGSISSIQDNTLLTEDSTLGDSKHLSKSNIDISGIMEDEEPRQPLPQKQSDSSAYDCDAIAQHHALLSSIHSSVLKDDADLPLVDSSLSEVNLGRFEFEVSDFFLFGSPLGLVLAMRSTVLPGLDGDALHNHSALFLENSSLNIPFSQEGSGSPNTSDQSQGKTRKLSLASTNSENSGSTESLPSACLTNITAKWWGTKRIDYALYCPDVLTAFPTVALPHLFHASYWESTDVVAFILRQVMRYENINFKENDNLDPETLSPSNPREKWLRKRTHVKLRNVTANHRANDVIAAEDGPQVLVGRFMYGPLDMVALTGEKVDIFIMTEPSSGRWVYFDTEISNSSGRISYNIPEQKRLRVGVYPIKMVVRGDQSSAASYLTVLPRGMECVVFSIDGSFAASVSIMGSDPKVRAGAVDVVSVLALSPSQIYIVGRPTKKYQAQCQFLTEGYAAHLASLEFNLHSRPKKNNSRMILRKGSFGLHSQPEFLRKRNHLRRTMSVQQPDPPSLNPKPERAQSQPESDKDHDRQLPSIAWVRGVHKFESVP
ncbi:Membrane-associated phosphatidylinositol transfer protein 3 [Pitangus sulphuratus]|nr:Membrane-associated phosphatidylinositol transfer protein 3 [Pitangus sulphuratus]